ncbi:MAG: single-stranded DNA-binding protein [Pseudonocardiaceae bacterium]|nr:single-stranded DNA-binding protein [Pseudonocardiaceae bacterium]
MSNDTTITIVGNLTADPELRFTATGDACVNFSIASTPRRYDKTQGQWVDGNTLFLRGTCWRDQASNLAESLHKGQRVIAVGRLRQSTWEKDGDKRTSIDLDVDEIGPSLRWATARVTRVSRDTATAPAPDPWASQSAAAGDSAPAWQPKPTPAPAGAGAPGGVPGFTDSGGQPPY